MCATPTADKALATDPTLPAFFLWHLASLATQQAASVSATERAALRIAMFSAYLDCLDLGLGAPARAILGRLDRQPEAPVQMAA